MNQSDMTLAAIIEDDACRMGIVDVDVAMTLIAVASEDPRDWGEIVDFWLRYQSPAVPEFADSISFADCGLDDITQAADQAEAWVVIDLANNRVLIGGEFQPVRRDDAFAMAVDDDGKQHWPLSIHLPPWWELHQPAAIEQIAAPRESPEQRPVINRDVLFGDAMLTDLADRVLALVASDRWQETSDDGERPYYDFTIEVHRDWLMTPREDLGGLMPRQMLHGARDWIDGLVWAQRLRFEDTGLMIAAPHDFEGYETAPMGSQEMVIYFDLCRELIGSAWEWCERDVEGQLAVDNNARSELVTFLREVKAEWLATPFEGGSPPRFIIECCRRRVPRGAGVEITGMTDRQSEQHVIDCDCPICNMMADGMFGVGFTSLDGYQLEIDDEFAFSMHETREEWDKQQREYEEMSADIERKRAEREAAGVSAEDEFASAWSGLVSDGPIPGDSRGHMKLAFLLAEFVTELQAAEADQAGIRQLNELFTEFRTCDSDALAETGRRLGDRIDSLADQYPDLVSRAADFRSRIDEQIRMPTVSDDLDFPF